MKNKDPKTIDGVIEQMNRLADLEKDQAGRYATTLRHFAKLFRNAADAEHKRMLDDLSKMKHMVRYWLKLLAKRLAKEQDNDPITSFVAFSSLVPLLHGIRFGCTSCRLDIKHRHKDPTGKIKFYGPVWRGYTKAALNELAAQSKKPKKNKKVKK